MSTIRVADRFLQRDPPSPPPWRTVARITLFSLPLTSGEPVMFYVYTPLGGSGFAEVVENPPQLAKLHFPSDAE